MDKPDFSTMSGAQLLETYNKLSAPHVRNSKFSDRKEGIQRCEQAWEAHQKKPQEPAPPPKKIDVRDNRVIRLTGDKNPRREGTDAARHWDAMVGSPTIKQYLDKFKDADRKKARQWLSNTVKDGHAKILG